MTAHPREIIKSSRKRNRSDFNDEYSDESGSKITQSTDSNSSRQSFIYNYEGALPTNPENSNEIFQYSTLEADAPIFTIWSLSKVDEFERWCTKHHLFDLEPADAWAFITKSLSNDCMEYLRALVVTLRGNKFTLYQLELEVVFAMLKEYFSFDVTSLVDEDERQRKKCRKKNSSTRRLCTYCGKDHNGNCDLKTHPDANLNPKIPWRDSKIGRAIISAKLGTSVKQTHRWNPRQKRLISLHEHINQYRPNG